MTSGDRQGRRILVGGDGLAEVRPGDGSEAAVRTTGALDGRAVDHLCAHPDGWLGIVDGAVWRDVPGRGWQPLARPPAGLEATCVVEHRGRVFVGTTRAQLLELVEGELHAVAAFAAAPTRELWHTPWGGPPDVRSMASDGRQLLVNVHVGGILRSGDGGAGWRATIDLATDVHQVVVGPGRLLLAATGTDALAVSADGGDKWTWRGAGLHARYCRAVTVAGDHLLLSASTGPSGGRAALYRAPLHGDGPFERCAAGDGWFRGNIDTHCLAATGRAAAFASEAGDVWWSEDDGATWRAAASLGTRPRVVVLA